MPLGAAATVSKQIARRWRGLRLEDSELRSDAQEVFDALVKDHAELLASLCVSQPRHLLDLGQSDCEELLPLLHKTLANRLSRLTGGGGGRDDLAGSDGGEQRGEEEGDISEAPHGDDVRDKLDNATLPKDALVYTLERRIESRKGWAKFRVGLLQLCFALAAIFSMDGDRSDLTSVQTMVMKGYVTNATLPWLSIKTEQDFWLWHRDVLLPLGVPTKNGVNVISTGKAYSMRDFNYWLSCKSKYNISKWYTYY